MNKMKFHGGPLDGQKLEVDDFTPVYDYAVKGTPLNAEYILASSADGVYEMNLHRYTSAEKNYHPDFHIGFGITLDEAIKSLFDEKPSSKALSLAIEVLYNLKSNPKAVALHGRFDNLEAQRMIAEAEQ